MYILSKAKRSIPVLIIVTKERFIPATLMGQSKSVDLKN